MDGRRNRNLEDRFRPARFGGLGIATRTVRVLTHCPPTTLRPLHLRRQPMAQKEYESLNAFWTTYEQGVRAEDDGVDEHVMAVMKTMFYQGAHITLRILNKAGLVDEEIPSVANLMQELRDVRIDVPESTEDANDVH
jgi:hypothetical protein